MKDGTLRQASKILSLFEETPGDQIQAILESGLLADLRDGNVAEVKRDDFRRVCGLKPLNLPLLEFIGSVAIPATEQFVAKDKFVVNTSHKAKVKIAWLGDNFKEWFLPKIEEPQPKMKLDYAKLTRSSLDAPIKDELGESKETTLTEIYTLLERQANGQKGVLLTNGLANIFYVLDANGELRTVCVDWVGGGWHVGAGSVAGPDGWFVGDRVFSCSSSVAVAV